MGSPEGARNPTCFSAALPGSLHSTPSPVDRERSIILSPSRTHGSTAPAAAVLTSRPHPAAHQVEVGEDAGGPVSLSHEQQHLVIDEVAVLLERVTQAQLQGLADLQAGRTGDVPDAPPFPPGLLGTVPSIYSEELRPSTRDWLRTGAKLGGKTPRGGKLAPSWRVPPPYPSPASALAPHPAHLFGSDAVQVTGVQYLP